MDFLIGKNFLCEKPGNPVGKVYYASEKGRKFVKEFKTLLFLME
jgi:hypothetical protein